MTNVNEAPTNIALSATLVAENQPSGTTVGTLTTTDPDTGDTFTYTLVAGTGDTDNASFSIEGGTLKTAASFDFTTQREYSIRVRSVDSASQEVESIFRITVTRAPLASTLVRDINPEPLSAHPNKLVELNGAVFFVADSGEHGYELWKSDGTQAGTSLVRDLRPGADSSNIQYLMNINGLLFFSANDGIHGQELWKSDGTSDGTEIGRAHV